MNNRRCRVRQRRVMTTLQALTRLSSRWAQRFEHRLAEVGLPDALPPSSFQALLRVLGVILDHRFDALRRAQDDREAWDSRLDRLRSMRDEETKEIVDLMVRLRSMTELVFGRVTSRELFGLGETSRSPRRLVEDVGLVLSRLDHPDYRALLQRREPVEWSAWWALVDRLRRPLGSLERILEELVVAEAAKTRSVKARNLAMDRLDDCQAGVTRMLEGLCRVTGEVTAIEELRP